MATENKYIENIFKTEEEIQNKITELAEKINEDYEGEELLLITVMKGGINFAADLQKRIALDCQVEYVRVKSYDTNGKFGKPEITSLNKIDAANKNIIFLEDLVDSGETIISLKEYYSEQNPKSIAVAATLGKPNRLELGVKEYYCWEEDPNGYLMGYGLDFTEKELFRNLPYIATIKKEYFE